MFCALSLDRERMRGRIFAAAETVVAVGDGLDARPHVASEEVHVIDVPVSVTIHGRTETEQHTPYGLLSSSFRQ